MLPGAGYGMVYKGVAQELGMEKPFKLETPNRKLLMRRLDERVVLSSCNLGTHEWIDVKLDIDQAWDLHTALVEMLGERVAETLRAQEDLPASLFDQLTARLNTIDVRLRTVRDELDQRHDAQHQLDGLEERHSKLCDQVEEQAETLGNHDNGLTNHRKWMDDYVSSCRAHSTANWERIDKLEAVVNEQAQQLQELNPGARPTFAETMGRVTPARELPDDSTEVAELTDLDWAEQQMELGKVVTWGTGARVYRRGLGVLEAIDLQVTRSRWSECEFLEADLNARNWRRAVSD